MSKQYPIPRDIALPSGIRVAVVASRFNGDIVQRLQEGCERALRQYSVGYDTFPVPGSVELPVVAAACARSGQYGGIVSLGVVIQGETDHYDYVCRMAADGIRSVSVQYVIPVAFGVLTCRDRSQAYARSLPDDTNAGFMAAVAVLETIYTLKRFDQ